MLNDIRADWTRRSVSVAALGAMAGAPSVGLANTVTVSNMDQLGAALGRARGGETILIAPGDYGLLFLRWRSFPSRVTLQAQDSRRPPRFSMIRMQNCLNINFVNVDVGGEAKPVNMNFTGFVDVRNSQNISIMNSRVTGMRDQAGGVSHDLGIFVRDCSEIRLENCIVLRMLSSLTIMNVNGALVNNNVFEEISADAIRCIGTSKAIIAGNSVSRFIPHPTEHCDGLQIFTSASVGPCTDIVIRNNTFVYGPALGTPQGIFIRSESRQPHRNITIENNLVYTEVWHSINLSNTIGGIIRNNTAIVPPNVEDRRSGGQRGAWIMVGQDSQDILVERNIANSYLLGPGVQRIQHRDNIQARRTTTAVPRTLIAGVADGTYQDLYGTETLGWTPPRTSLIARSGARTASSSARIGYLG